MMEPDIVLANGRVVTLNRNMDIVDALAIKHGRILALGQMREIRYHRSKYTRTLDLRGRTVVPGFIDSHTHFVSMGVRKNGLQLNSTKSLADLQRRLGSWASKTPRGRWIIGYQWDESKWDRKEYPTAGELDRATSRHPALLFRVDGHLAVVNTQALKLLNIPPKTRGFIADRNGRPLGIVKEDALEHVWPRTQNSEGRQASLSRAVKDAQRLGVTSLHDMVSSPLTLALYQKTTRNGNGVRIYACLEKDLHERLLASTLMTGFGNETLRIGALKFYADGSIGSRTAAITAPYSDDRQNNGVLMYDQGELNGKVAEAHRQGFQVAMHGIGERGIDAALEAIETAVKNYPRKEHRHRIEHVELATDEQIERMASLGVIASMQPNFTGEWGLPDGMYQERLGNRWRKANRFRTMLDAGVTVAFGSDCMPFSPLYGIHWAVNGPAAGQRVTLDEAMRCYTICGAYASFEEKLKGSLEEGKFADLTVLSHDPWLPETDVRKVKVGLTMLNGEIVYSSGDLGIRGTH